ncbi:amidase [Nocardioides aequoreus]|uniref:amidase n=1 Tax=Nocardioides aequoreus TaxID=397278 RepID=UPI0004C40477|nr:amidase [Nocardioides aequoreus]
MVQQPAEPRARVHAFTDDAMGDDDAVELVARIRAGTVSRREVVQAAVERSRRLDEALAAVAAERYAAAVVEASAPHEGFFAGVPTFVKDNSDVAGLPTQQGSRAYVARPAAADGDVARVLGTLGLTVLGKTRLSEYGFSASAEFVHEPPVRNPWHLEHSSGASSAGAAVLVAGGAVPLAHANDGGGSIRIPAAVNGLVGLKATRGRIPSDRANREMPVRIVHDGVLTRSVRDTAAFVREAERAYRDLSLPPVGDVTRPGRKRLRVALVTESLGGRAVDDEVLAVVRATAALLERLGHDVEPTPVPAPESFVEDFLDYWAFLALALTTSGRRGLGPDFDATRHDELTRGLAARARGRLWRMPLAIGRLRASQRRSRRFFADHDLVLSPTLATVTPRLGWLHPGQPYETVIERLVDWVAFTPLQNATGDPSISLPLGTSSQGLPVGVMLSGPRGHDRRLLEVAYELEEAQPFARIQVP